MWAGCGKLQAGGHGHTPDIDRPLSCRAMARDTKGLLAYLGIDSVDVLGYSDGASVALELAVNHPGLVRSLVLASGVFDFSGSPPEMSEGLKHLRKGYHSSYIEDEPQALLGELDAFYGKPTRKLS